MATLLITEAPGGIGDAFQCPTCGRLSLVKRVDDQGMPTEEDAEPPRTCPRCKSPMDTEGELPNEERFVDGKYKGNGSPAQKFQDAMATAAANKPQPRQSRRTVKV